MDEIDIIYELKKYYVMNKHSVVKFIIKLSNMSNVFTDYSLSCVRMLDDYFERIVTIKQFGDEEFESIVVYTCLVSFWIVNKYIEDDSFFLNDLLKISPARSVGSKILMIEISVFMTCPDLHKYVHRETE